MLKTTRRWTDYWRKRKIDWRSAFGAGRDAVEHPHRNLIVAALKRMRFGSVCELGMGGGANLVRIRRDFPSVQVGGVDVSAAAIRSALSALPDGIFDVRSAHDLFFSDKSVDVVLMDMAAIYLSPSYLRKCLKEVRRIARKHVIFVEFHHESLLARLALKWATGYNSYDWRKELERAGFHDVEMRKLTEEDWPGGSPQREFAWIITASLT